MRAYILNDADLERLRLMIARDPRINDASAGDPAKVAIYHDAHRFYVYQVESWLKEVCDG